MESAEALKQLVGRLERGPIKQVARRELQAFPALYRRAVSELSEARARGAPRARILEGEGLVLRAHALLYTPEAGRLDTSFVELMRAFPKAVRQSGRYVALAAALLLLGGVAGYAEVHREPASASVLLPGSLGENAEKSFKSGKPPREGDPLFGAMYFTHNTQVAMLAYALGTTFGVGTVLSMFHNGVAIGATYAVVELTGSPRAFWSFVIPHGGVELAAIAIAAAAGLRIGHGLLRPGPRRRRDALRHQARESLPLALGAAALLAVAGLVEGWFSPSPWPFWAKVALGLWLDGLLFVYLWKG